MPVVFLVLVLSLVTSVNASAAPPCLADDNECDPDKLCTFKAALAEKTLLYQLYLKNSQVTKQLRKRKGVRYDGKLYNEAMAEARERFSDRDAAEQLEQAGAILQEKIRRQAAEEFKLPTCRYGGTLQLDLLPRDGYNGMYTDEHCNYWVDYQKGEYDPNTFGRNDSTCPEFFDRDRAHEVIHQRRCRDDKEKGRTDREQIGPLIEDEIAAYEHSVKLSKAYVRLLAIQCSSKARPSKIRARAEQVRALLEPYLKKGGEAE